MATIIQQLRGSTAQNDGFTGPSGVITVDETAKDIRVHDGSKTGGYSVAHAASKTPASFSKTDGLTAAKLFAKETASADMQAQKVIDSKTAFNPNGAGGNFSSFHIRTVAEGTNINGPRGATLGASISTFKEGFGTGTAKTGEIDALYIVLRQDSPRNGVTQDGCGILIDAAVYENVGFVGGIEGATAVLRNSDGAQIRRISYQIGCVDTTTGSDTAIFANAAIGQIDNGILLQSDYAAGNYFENFIVLNDGSRSVFRVNRSGQLFLGSRTGSTSTRGIQVDTSGTIGFLNAAATVQVVTIANDGTVDMQGSLTAAGTVTATFGLRGGDLMITPGAKDGTSTTGFKRGQMYVGAGGRLRYCETDGAQPKFVSMQTT